MVMPKRVVRGGVTVLPQRIVRPRAHVRDTAIMKGWQPRDPFARGFLLVVVGAACPMLCTARCNGGGRMDAWVPMEGYHDATVIQLAAGTKCIRSTLLQLEREHLCGYCSASATTHFAG